MTDGNRQSDKRAHRSPRGHALPREGRQGARPRLPEHRRTHRGLGGRPPALRRLRLGRGDGLGEGGRRKREGVARAGREDVEALRPLPRPRLPRRPLHPEGARRRVGVGALPRPPGRHRLPRRQRGAHPPRARRGQQHLTRDGEAAPGPRPPRAQPFLPAARGGARPPPPLERASRPAHGAGQAEPRRARGGGAGREVVGRRHPDEGRRREGPRRVPRGVPLAPRGHGGRARRRRKEGAQEGLGALPRRQPLAAHPRGAPRPRLRKGVRLRRRHRRGPSHRPRRGRGEAGAPRQKTTRDRGPERTRDERRGQR